MTVAVAALALGVAACGKGADKSAEQGSGSGGEGGKAKPAGTIVVGHYGSMTGSEATFGRSTDNGIRLATEERNAAGGINTAKVEVVTLDDAGKSSEAGTAVTRLINDHGAKAILGEVASSLSLAGGEVAQEAGVPMITPSSTNATVTEIGDMIFRVCFVDSFQGYVMAKFARENLKTEKVAILFDQSGAYSKGLAADFKAAYAGLGGAISAERTYTKGDPDVSAQLQAIQAAGADAIFLPGYYTDVGNIVGQARKLGITAPFLGGDGWDSAELAKIAGEAIEGSYYSNHYSHEEDRPEVKAFVEKYKAKFGQVPDGLAALGYDAAAILYDAMARAKSLGGKDLAAAIAETRDYKGVTGTISIDPQRNATKSAVILQYKGGVPTMMTRIEPAK